MGGDGIASARRALRSVAECLGETDETSLTRFGSTVRHVVGAGPCGSRHLARLRSAIDDTDKNLGGTEMHRALQAVFSAWPRRDTGTDVLLITDGEVWGAETSVASARRSGHRVFAIGVGSAPAEGVLRDLTDATGGVVEFATPGESLERAAERMLGRIRQVPSAPPVVDWGAVPVWQLPLQPQAFGGGSAFDFAGLASREAPGQAVRLMEALPNSASSEIARTAVIARNAASDLARIAAARRMVHASQADVARPLCLSPAGGGPGAARPWGAQERPAMDVEQYIEIRPGVRSGKPCFKRTRITVHDVLEYLAGGRTEAELLDNFPALSAEHLRAALMFAAARERRLAGLPADGSCCSTRTLLWRSG